MKTNKWFIFVLVAIAQFMVVLDSAITNVALPTIKNQMHFSNSMLQWVVTAYALTFGGFLLLGGRAADLYGRRKTLLIGMGGFTVFSFLIGISHSAFLLIALRALQGSAAALMSPSALSIVLTTFRDGPDRNKALSYWTLVATAGAAAGLLLGGILTQYVGWRWDFFVNVPVGILMSVAISKYVPLHEKEDSDKTLDLSGAVLITASLMSMVFAFSQASSWGWTNAKSIGIFAASLILGAAFVANEKRVKHPLVPMKIFKVRNITGANLIMAPMYGTMLGIFFIITLYLQTILKYSPVQAGLAFIPMPIVLGFMSTRIPKLVARYGYKRFLIAGPLIVSIGLVLLTQLKVGSSYGLNILPSLLIIPFGIGMTFMPLIAAATSGVPANESGLASGLISTSQQMGGAVGLSILSGVAASVTASSLDLGKKVALVHGFDRAMDLAVSFMLFAAILAIFVIKQKPTPKGKEKTSKLALVPEL